MNVPPIWNCSTDGSAPFLVSQYNFVGESQRVVTKHHEKPCNPTDNYENQQQKITVLSSTKISSARVKASCSQTPWTTKNHGNQSPTLKIDNKNTVLSPVQLYRRESANIGHHWGFRLLTLVYCIVGWGHHINISRNQHYAFLDLETNKLLVTMALDSSGHLICVKVQKMKRFPVVVDIVVDVVFSDVDKYKI